MGLRVACHLPLHDCATCAATGNHNLLSERVKALEPSSLWVRPGRSQSPGLGCPFSLSMLEFFFPSYPKHAIMIVRHGKHSGTNEVLARGWGFWGWGRSAEGRIPGGGAITGSVGPAGSRVSVVGAHASRVTNCGLIWAHSKMNLSFGAWKQGLSSSGRESLRH